jgi:hypothetical protein
MAAATPNPDAQFNWLESSISDKQYGDLTEHWFANLYKAETIAVRIFGSAIRRLRVRNVNGVLEMPPPADSNAHQQRSTVPRNLAIVEEATATTEVQGLCERFRLSFGRAEVPVAGRHSKPESISLRLVHTRLHITVKLY